MAVVKSDISENLDRDKMFAEGWFIQYCCCTGTINGNVGNPRCGAEEKQICVHRKLWCTDVGDPFCSSADSCLCLTRQCSLPPMEGSPTCVCCNKKLAGTVGDGWKPKLFDYEFKFDETFWLYYFICLGTAVNGVSANGRPCCAGNQKQLCIKQESKFNGFCEGGSWCSGLGTQLCCWSQTQFPPAENSPKIGICGCRMNKASGAGGSPMSYGKPGQTEMK